MAAENELLLDSATEGRQQREVMGWPMTGNVRLFLLCAVNVSALGRHCLNRTRTAIASFFDVDFACLLT